jgi:hypothetical protein
MKRKPDQGRASHNRTGIPRRSDQGITRPIIADVGERPRGRLSGHVGIVPNGAGHDVEPLRQTTQSNDCPESDEWIEVCGTSDQGIANGVPLVLILQPPANVSLQSASSAPPLCQLRGIKTPDQVGDLVTDHLITMLRLRPYRRRSPSGVR